MIPVHREPASFIPENAIFDNTVSHLCVRSEHCIGALKGRFQSLRGLQVSINSNRAHIEACRWITIAIILHNLVIDIEGRSSAAHFGDIHTRAEEEEDGGAQPSADYEAEEEEGENKRKGLTAQLLAYREMRGPREVQN